MRGPLYLLDSFFFSVHEWEIKKKAAYGIPLVVRRSVEGTSEVQGEENGLYDDVTVRHPSSSGIKDCTSTTVPFNLIFLSQFP